MAATPASPAELDAIEARIDAYLARELEENPVVLAVDRAEPGTRRWYVRLRGEEKDFTTVWLTIHQRTLQYETYVLPAPEENHARFYEHLLRRNHGFNGAAFEIGDEDAVFLRGQISVDTVTDDELDRIIGSLYAYVERCFRPALRIAFESRFAGA
ncbi:MAG TPA: YbjN domain-containing protein [Aquihabitans sp.]|jgi:hypothetical protein|nr:YbjN domain-containing protein [Aquihabitans sp.]